ncbi:MAG: hypothetical protein HY918_00785 [Candidatus Doudnabacteria bacterium]|nr:hypothetical protein [Candidatus Doudnabacteria bacterium]
MNNLQLLKHCSNHPEPVLDESYMFIEKHKDLSLYAKKTQEIKNQLITLKELNKQKSKEVKKVEKNIYHNLAILLEKNAQFSEFGCFINACDATVEVASKNLQALEKITKLYLEKRDLNDIVPGEWIQALIDKTSSRKKGQAGEEKLIKILKSKGYLYTEKFETFIKNKKSVSKFKGDFTLNGILKNFKVQIGKDSQNKKMDLCVKNGKDIYFLEAKHISISGGAQNKQIKELIDILKNKLVNSKFHQVSFLDGAYFNLLFSKNLKLKNAIKKSILKNNEFDDGESPLNKIESQKVDINNALKLNTGNFFINTAGFNKLF